MAGGFWSHPDRTVELQVASPITDASTARFAM
jgi:hypothetical protein